MENQAACKSPTHPQFGYLHHISLPCSNLAEAKRFYIEVLGGELYHDTPGFAEVALGGMIVGLSEQGGGWTGPDAEYPHYGFNVEPADFALAQPWFAGCDVPTHGWTRNYKTALLYFRDPSGNLLELYCDNGFGGISSLALGPRQGGVALPLAELNYKWSGKVANSISTRPRLASFAHLSVPVKDIEQAKRFFIEVMGGEPLPTSDPATFTEVRVAGAIVGLSTRSGVWTGPNAEYPHYAFYADGQNFLPLIDWLRCNGVVTPGPWTRDGKKGLMYFRDPSGNLFEIYCGKDIPQAAHFPRGVKQGGSYAPNYSELFYDWHG
jgi:catechol 2,3-dioxygenase-like lactoylglutathione lyase family enzyme